MKMEKNLDNHFTANLLSFLNQSPSPFHAVANAKDVLKQNGFTALSEGEEWKLEKGRKYYVVRGQSAIVVFETGEGDVPADGFRIVGAHTDSPTFKIKPGPVIVTKDGYMKLNVEAYGGAIYSTWLDRPLSIAGRVCVGTPNAMLPEVRLYDAKCPLALIPNLCIHLNRQINSGHAYNVQVDLQPIIGIAEPGTDGTSFLQDLMAESLQVGRGDIIDHDLFLYDAQPGCRLGNSGAGEYISASRIDNLAMVFAGIAGIVGSAKFPGVKVMIAFDNEEVGSATREGADGDFLPGMLRRIAASFGIGAEGMQRAFANSMAISADAAHAVHPNYADRHDPENHPVMGGGPTIKYSAAQRYATNAVTAAVFAGLCASAGIPTQKYVNRSDLPAGSTVGPALSRYSSIPTVDVGAPILAMHSIRELANASDVFFMAQAFQHFFSYQGK